MERSFEQVNVIRRYKPQGGNLYNVRHIGLTFGNTNLCASFKGKEENFGIVIHEGSMYINRKGLSLYIKMPGIHEKTRAGIRKFLNYRECNKAADSADTQQVFDFEADQQNVSEIEEPIQDPTNEETTPTADDRMLFFKEFVDLQERGKRLDIEIKIIKA